MDIPPFLVSNIPLLSPILRLYEPEAAAPSLDFWTARITLTGVKSMPGLPGLVSLFFSFNNCRR
jgi:hypothetical protein